ncbi:MAG: CinA family protein [Spirochaetales bacterium]
MQLTDSVFGFEGAVETAGENAHTVACIPGMDVDDVRGALEPECATVGLRSFSMGTEIRGSHRELESAIARLSRFSDNADVQPVAVFSSIETYLEAVVRRMKSAGVFLVAAESCTAGLVTATLTEVPGSSSVLWGGFIVYSNEAKIRIGVPPEIIESTGAVSRETVCSLVEASLDRSSANTAVAVSGIAGPGGGTEAKPVGTVWVAAGTQGRRQLANERHFRGDRSKVRLLAVGACHAAVLRVTTELTEQ